MQRRGNYCLFRCSILIALMVCDYVHDVKYSLFIDVDIFSHPSLSTLVLNSRDRQGNLELPTKVGAENNLTTVFSFKILP